MVKPLIIKKSKLEIIGYGGNAWIYSISPNRVAKVSSWRISDNEIEIQKKLFEKGYPVPRPYDVYTINVEGGLFSRSKLVEGFFMEKIHGKNLEDRPNSEELFEEAKEIVGDIKRRENIIISPIYQLYPKNVMYDKKNNRVVLVDFGNWRRI